MKIVSLNTWGGEVGTKPLVDFFAQHADVDVFCLQEVWNGGEHMLKEKSAGSWLGRRNPKLLSEFIAALPEYVSYYRPHFHDFYGLVTFVRKGIPVLEEGELYIYKEKGFVSDVDFGNHARILQYLLIETASGPRLVGNLHALWNGRGKTDCDERLEQSDRIVAFLRGRSEPIAIVGDFNLLPTTESVKRIEAAGLRNLITEYGITSTRTSFYAKPEKFADYAFVSPEIEVQDFKVLPDEVSDHAPLYLEFI
jgi:exonuclease III